MAHPSIEQQVTFIYTRDLSATAHFYEALMGFPLVLDQGTCRIYRVGREGFLGCCQSDQAPKEVAGIILTFVTGEVDKWYRYLSEQGIEFEKPPTYNPTYKIYQCFLRDPNGYLLEIQQFLDPAWPGSGQA